MEAVSDPIVSRAIEWMVLLRSGTASVGDVQAFAGWRSADPRHEAACRRIEGVLGGFSPCSEAPDASRKALLAKRRTLKLLAGCGVAVMAGGLTRNGVMSQPVFPDLSTGIARQEVVSLADGSALTLNARTRLNRNAAGVRILDGEVFVQHALTRQISVQTNEGGIYAGVAEFAVRQARGFSRIAVLDGSVKVQPISGAGLSLHAGEVARLRPGGVELLRGISAAAETAWRDGLLEVADRPLREVVEALDDYRRGIIHVAGSVADLRVSGVFPLGDTRRALSALVAALPIRMVFNSDYLVWIVPA